MIIMKKIKIQIYINGKNINSNCNLIDILKEYSLINKLVAVEINQEVIPKSSIKL